MINYYTLDTLGIVFNTDKKKIEEIITTHESGKNEYQNDPSSVFSSYVKYDSYSQDGITRYRLYFANTVGLDEEEEDE